LTPTYCLKNATTRYRYYKCLGAVQRGVGSCSSKSVPAGTIEAFVLEQIRALAGDPERLQAMQANRNTNDTADTVDEREPVEPGKLGLILDPAWDRLDWGEWGAILSGLIEQVINVGASSKVTITFRREGIRARANPENHA
jgi:Recombinase zinc beta ribbon domain